MLERIFKLKENGTTVRNEIVGGLVIFFSMAYILAVEPSILGDAGMDKGSVFVATALAAAISTIFMAIVAKLPFALAPGMGMNAFFTYTVVLGLGYSWQMALTAVFIEGLIFIALTYGNIREKLILSIPLNLKHGISVGIGLFIAFIGLQLSGIVVKNDSTLLTFGNIFDKTVILSLAGILLLGILMAKRVKGAFFIEIIVITIIGIPLGITHVPDSLNLNIPSIAPTFAKFDLQWIHSLTGIINMIVIVFTFLFMDLYNTLGTFIGVSSKAGLLDEKGNMKNVKPALMADAIGTTIGGLLGVSTVTTYVESATGIGEGSKTGLTALVVGILFILSIVFAPYFLMIPTAATSPVFLVLGAIMFEEVKAIKLDDITESLPAYITMLAMPFTYSISNGIFLGMISYTIIKLFSGKVKDLNITLVVMSVLFIVYYVFVA